LRCKKVTSKNLIVNTYLRVGLVLTSQSSQNFYGEGFSIQGLNRVEQWKASDTKKNTAVLGLVFVIILGLSCAENHFFFSILGDVLQNQLLAVGMLFMHNVLVVSMILIGMTFYVNLVVLNFFKRDKHVDVVMAHPRIFAAVLACIIVFLSILRGATLINGGITLETFPLILLASTLVGIIEGYGIYLTIKKTLSRTMTMKALAYIYGVFFLALVIEVGFITLLTTFAS